MTKPEPTYSVEIARLRKELDLAYGKIARLEEANAALKLEVRRLEESVVVNLTEGHLKYDLGSRTRCDRT